MHGKEGKKGKSKGLVVGVGVAGEEELGIGPPKLEGIMEKAGQRG